MKPSGKFRISLIIWLIGLASAFMSGCQAQEPIKVGFVAGLTGRTAALGVDGRDGVILAIDEINEVGGIGGRPIELIIRDDLATPEGAIAADRELIAENVVAIIGHMTSETMIAVWPLVEESGVVFVSPTVSTPQVSGIADHFFRLMPANSNQASRLASYAADELGIRSAIIFYDEDNLAYTRTYRDGFAERFEQSGGQILRDFPFSSSEQPDFRPMLKQVDEISPDTVFIIASAIDTALIAQQARLMGFGKQILICNWALTDDLLHNGGHAVEGVLAITAHDENDQSVRRLEFQTQFLDRFGRRPTFGAVYGYEAALVLAKAIEKTKGQSEGLSEALLETKDFAGINGTITLDEYGDVIRAVYLITVKEGEFITLASLDYPDSQ